MKEYYEGYKKEYDKAISLIKDFENCDELIKELYFVDFCTDGMGTYIVNLIYNHITTRDDYYKFFGKSEWSKVWLARYDKKNICYLDKELGMEFIFLNNHHSCYPILNFRGIIKRMTREVYEIVYPGLYCMDSLSNNFKNLLKSTIDNVSNIKTIKLIKEEINPDAWEDYCEILEYDPDKTNEIEVEVNCKKDV